MKNQFLLFLCFLISCFSFGQRKYSFDYALVYDFQLSDSSKVEQRIFLTNSKDNSYFLEVKEKDSLNYTLSFLDHNGYYSKTLVSKSDFFKAETINAECESVLGYQNPYRYQVENYDYHTMNDTLIDGENYFGYFLKCNKPKREKRKKLGILFYIVEKNTDFHLPVLLAATPYEEWKTQKNIPNGIPKLFYFESYKTKKILWKHSLTGYKKIDKYIMLPKGCPKFNFFN